jgi:hypothetical protein
MRSQFHRSHTKMRDLDNCPIVDGIELVSWLFVKISCVRSEKRELPTLNSQHEHVQGSKCRQLSNRRRNRPSQSLEGKSLRVIESQTKHITSLARTHNCVTLPPEQINPEPTQFDEALNRGQFVALLQPAQKQKLNSKRL